jgi:hypothetical protein
VTQFQLSFLAKTRDISSVVGIGKYFTAENRELGSSQVSVKKGMAVGCAFLIFLAFCPVTFAQQTAQLQDTEQTAPSATDTEQKNVQEYVELLRRNVRQQEAEIMGA